MKNIFHANEIQNQVGGAIFLSDKTNFKTKLVGQNKKKIPIYFGKGNSVP